MDDRMQTVEPAPQAQIDFSQLAPLVMEFQKGEIEKQRLAYQANVETQKIASDTNIAIAQMKFTRQTEVDKASAAKDIRQDKYDGVTTGLLFIAYAALFVYGIHADNNGFITAGVTGFASFLAGKHSSTPKEKKELAD